MSQCLAQKNALQGQEDPIGEQKKDLGYFDKVAMADGGNLIINQSPVTMLKVVGKSSCLKSVQAVVKSQTLEISRTNNSPQNCDAKIYISTPTLKEIQQDGGGTVKINKSFGTMDSFHCVLNGGGAVDMKTQKVNSFYATINGGGTISIHANKLLKADIKGGGLISYQGNPEVVSDISGGGSVKRN